jgi:hypothetical protein
MHFGMKIFKLCYFRIMRGEEIFLAHNIVHNIASKGHASMFLDHIQRTRVKMTASMFLDHIKRTRVKMTAKV